MKVHNKSRNELKLALAFLGGGVVSGAIAQTAHAETVTVKKGQTLKSIAKDKHISAETLAKNNNLKLDCDLSPNQELDVPEAPKKYTVKEGDTVSEIAHAHGLETADVLKWNDLSWDDSVIFIGDELNLQDPTINQPDDTTATPVSNNGHVASIVGSTQAEQVVNLAKQYASMNIPYVWGGSTPSGFDCSGLTSYIFNQIGIGIGRTTIAQEAHVQSTDISDASQVAAVAQPGDLLFWGGHGSTYHVGIYIGNNQFVAAPQPGQNVSVQAVSNYFKPSFVGRIVQ